MNQPGYPYQPQGPSLPPRGPQPITPGMAMPQPLGAGTPMMRPVPVGQGPRPLQAPMQAPLQGPRPIPAGMPQPLPPGAATPETLRHKTPEEEEAEQKDVAEVAIKKAPPWLISAVVHMVILIGLALFMLTSKPENTVVLDSSWAPVEGEQLEDENFTVEVEEPEPVTDVSVSDAQPVPDPLAAPPKLESLPILGTAATSQIVAPSIGNALNGRSEGAKKAMLSKYGGTVGSEQAVQLGLAWLAKQQNKHNGSWSLKGPYADGSGLENSCSATAMALLAFQGNGNTHQKGQYKDVVKKGWDYLLAEQSKDGSFFNGDGAWSHEFYTHGQGMIACNELYAMSRDGKFKDPAERAIAYAIKGQHRLGGWKYTPQSDSDTSVTGWILMGLQSARMARLPVPPDVLENVSRYLDKAGLSGDSQYAYSAGGGFSEVMTAEGLLCRQYLGWEQKDERLLRGADLLLASHLPRWEQQNVYYWYYATQMFHHLEGERWDRWNKSMRDLLVQHQKKSGPDAGSWDPQGDKWGNEGGRLYVTCLSIYILEVYYRHLPLYSAVKL